MTAVVDVLWRVFALNWLTGPIFEKELRVAARRRRSYVLRFLYVGLLTVFIAVVWMLRMEEGGSASGAYSASRMAGVGKDVTSAIVWFQFIATQLIAVVMLSTAISDEIYNRTLGALMTTPINSFQIIMGKLFSRLWQLMILLAISLPLLAIVRVFGGVPWDYTVASLCITLTAILFAGSLSLLFSIGNRKAYSVVLRTLIALAVLYAFIPFAVAMLLGGMSSTAEPGIISLWQICGVVLIHTNPFAALDAETFLMQSPGMAGAAPGFLWPVHCLIMVAFSTGLLSWCVRKVRRVALAQAAGDTGRIDVPRYSVPPPLAQPVVAPPVMAQPMAGLPPVPVGMGAPRAGAAAGPPPLANAAPVPRASVVHHAAVPIRRVTGSPVLWKELRTPWISGGRTRATVGIVVAVGALLLTYALAAYNNVLDESETHAAYTAVFLGLGILVTCILSATPVSSEKEARTWPILLGTPLSNAEILLAKGVGVLRRCVPVWLFLAGHVTLFMVFGVIRPIAAVHVLMVTVWAVVFVTCTGLYFSTRFRHTTTAVVANLGLIATLWLIVPFLFGMMSSYGRFGDRVNLGTVLIAANPAAQGVVVMEAGSGSRRMRYSADELNYHWPTGDCGVVATTGWLTFFVVFHVGIGAIFFLLAVGRLRRDVF